MTIFRPSNIFYSDEVSKTISRSLLRQESSNDFINSILQAFSNLRTGWYVSLLCLWGAAVVQEKVSSTKGLTLVPCSVLASYVFVFLVFFPSSSLGLLSPYPCTLLSTSKTSSPDFCPSTYPPSLVETVQSNAQLLLDSGPPLSLRCQETISETCIPVPVLNWQEGSLKATPATMECV